jgi:hypothetical protein
LVVVGCLGEFLARDLTALPRLFELFVARGVDCMLAAFESILGGDEADG